jgi:hemerythrin superfamily protein
MDDALEVADSPIRDRFLADHQRLESLLQRLVAAFASNDREDMARLWAEFDAGLLAHMEAEEKHLIPALLRAGAREARILVQEHRHIRARMTELGTAVDLHLARLDSVRDFIDELRAHAQSEDRILYRWADEHFDDPGRASVIDALTKKAP